jgi:DNA-binding XRE family transcriptional regulator
MGVVVWFPSHGRASAGSCGVGSRAARSARTSKVISGQPFSPASLTSGAQCGAGIPPARSRQPLTVDLESDRASATCVVPPSASMIVPGVSMETLIVRSVRTSQEFARRETTFSRLRVPILVMVDSPKVIGPRLKSLRLALDVPTQVEFAAQIGVEKNTYNPWEKGTRPLTFEGACLIRKRFKIPLDYLFFGEIGELPVRVHQRILRQNAA